MYNLFEACRFVCYFFIFRHLSLMAEECSDDMLLKWFRVIECLGAGGVCPADDIIQAIPVFTMYPYHFSTLPRQHIVSFYLLSNILVNNKLFIMFYLYSRQCY